MSFSSSAVDRYGVQTGDHCETHRSRTTTPLRPALGTPYRGKSLNTVPSNQMRLMESTAGAATISHIRIPRPRSAPLIGCQAAGYGGRLKNLNRTLTSENDQRPGPWVALCCQRASSSTA